MFVSALLSSTPSISCEHERILAKHFHPFLLPPFLRPQCTSNHIETEAPQSFECLHATVLLLAVYVSVRVGHCPSVSAPHSKTHLRRLVRQRASTSLENPLDEGDRLKHPIRVQRSCTDVAWLGCFVACITALSVLSFAVRTSLGILLTCHWDRLGLFCRHWPSHFAINFIQ